MKEPGLLLVSDIFLEDLSNFWRFQRWICVVRYCMRTTGIFGVNLADMLFLSELATATAGLGLGLKVCVSYEYLCYLWIDDSYEFDESGCESGYGWDE